LLLELWWSQKFLRLRLARPCIRVAEQEPNTAVVEVEQHIGGVEVELNIAAEAEEVQHILGIVPGPKSEQDKIAKAVRITILDSTLLVDIC